jgi:hypothetical protein
MTRARLLARLMSDLRRDKATLDSLYGNQWRPILRDLEDLRLLTVTHLDNGNVLIYVRKQNYGRTR